MTDTDLDRVLNKIQRLLALADGAGPEEREAALLAAQRLMERYSVSREAVDQAAAGRSAPQYCEATADEYTRTPVETEPVCAVLQQCLHVRVIAWSRREGTRGIDLFGEPHHVAFARHAYVFLARTFREKWTAHCRQLPGRPRSGARGYYWGLAHAVIDTLEQDRGADTAQALIRIDTRLDDALPDLPVRHARKIPDHSRFGDGLQDGRDIRLHRPLPGDAAPLRALTADP